SECGARLWSHAGCHWLRSAERPAFRSAERLALESGVIALEECHMLQDFVVKLKINSPVVRDAWLDGVADVVVWEKKPREKPTEPLSWFSQERCRRRIAAATAL